MDWHLFWTILFQALITSVAISLIFIILMMGWAMAYAFKPAKQLSEIRSEKIL